MVGNTWSLLSCGGDMFWAQNGEELLIPVGYRDCTVLKLEVSTTHNIAHLGTSEASGVGYLTMCFLVSSPGEEHSAHS